MELRKVQLTGGSSLTITLPKVWADRAKIRPGDLVGCAEQPDGSLVVHAHMKTQRKAQQYSMDVEDGAQEQLFRRIVGVYLTGYDSIRVTSRRPFDADARRVVREAIRRIVGLEVVEEQPNSIVVQDFLDPGEFHMERALRRMGMLTQAMQEDALALIRSNSAKGNNHVKQTPESDDEVDRLYWLINKQYHALLRDATYAGKMGLSAVQALNFLLTARIVERTADHAARIQREAALLATEKVPEAILLTLEKNGRKATELFQTALQVFHKRDFKRANLIIEDANKFAEQQKKMLREAGDAGSDAAAHLALIIESIVRTAAYAADVAEVAINHLVAYDVPPVVAA